MRKIAIFGLFLALSNGFWAYAGCDDYLLERLPDIALSNLNPGDVTARFTPGMAAPRSLKLEQNWSERLLSAFPRRTVESDFSWKVVQGKLDYRSKYFPEEVSRDSVSSDNHPEYLPVVEVDRIVENEVIPQIQAYGERLLKSMNAALTTGEVLEWTKLEIRLTKDNPELTTDNPFDSQDTSRWYFHQDSSERRTLGDLEFDEFHVRAVLAVGQGTIFSPLSETVELPDDRVLRTTHGSPYQTPDSVPFILSTRGRANQIGGIVAPWHSRPVLNIGENRIAFVFNFKLRQ